MIDPKTAQPDMIAIAEAMYVKSGAGAILARACGANEPLCQSEILLGRELEVAGAAFDDGDLQSSPFRNCRVVREIRSAGFDSSVMRVENLGETKALRGLCAPEILT